MVGYPFHSNILLKCMFICGIWLTSHIFKQSSHHIHIIVFSCHQNHTVIHSISNPHAIWSLPEIDDLNSMLGTTHGNIIMVWFNVVKWKFGRILECSKNILQPNHFWLNTSSTTRLNPEDMLELPPLHPIFLMHLNNQGWNNRCPHEAICF